LARKLEAPQSVISEFRAGKRELSKLLVLKLANQFKVSPVISLAPSSGIVENE
jgi:plasmid maintenance system antidote protein VapI